MLNETVVDLRRKSGAPDNPRPSESSGKLPDPRRRHFSSLTYADFDKKLRKFNIDNSQFARLTGYDLGTVRAWRNGEKKIPLWVDLVLEYLSKNREVRLRSKWLGPVKADRPKPIVEN